MMEDKRKEELKEKADAASACLEEINICEEEIAKISEIFKFIERYWYCDIWVKQLTIKIKAKLKNLKFP